MDPQLGVDLESEIAPLQERLPFGLNFEKHQPEAVELPGVSVRVGSKVRMLPPRSSGVSPDRRLWRIEALNRANGTRFADLSLVRNSAETTIGVPVSDLTLVAEFRDPIYPGLRSTGSVRRGGPRPAHTVINGDNFHVLEALTFTHRGRIDAIYIDPPYNTGARDWKYNNDYVESDDLYRHSKWLAFIERRLQIAQKLLNPRNSVLIVTIDEKEYLRLGLLLEQTFPEARIQMVTSVISQRGVARDGTFSRVDEYLFFVFFGDARANATSRDLLGSVVASKPRQMWFQFRRNGEGSLRQDSPNLFYPILINAETGKIIDIGAPLDRGQDRSTFEVPNGLTAIWPLREDGTEARWRTGVDVARANVEDGYLRVGSFNEQKQLWSVLFINEGGKKAIALGEVKVKGRAENGSAILDAATREAVLPKTVWNSPSHDAGWHGSRLLAAILPGRRFPYPKSLYAVEDALSIFLTDKPDAIVLDFFAGSGTTAHAVMRLNHQDEGNRQTILVTNNEVSADEQASLYDKGFRPGDPEWEAHGICEFITKPRITAVVTGETPEGSPLAGEYRDPDAFPLKEGFEENVEFFTLTYESVWQVSQNRAFAALAPLLWLRAGSIGRRIDSLELGWDVAESYGVLGELDKASQFISKVRATPTIRIVYIITDDDRRFQMVSESLAEFETVRLYSSYLQDFQINSGQIL